MRTRAKTCCRAGFTIGLIWLNCPALQADQGLVDAQGQLRRDPHVVTTDWWLGDLLAMLVVVACALLWFYRLIRARSDSQRAFAKQQAGLLAQARREVGQLEALLEFRAEALQTTQLTAYEARRDHADLLACAGNQLQQQADDILSEAGAIVREAAGDGTSEKTILSGAKRLHSLVVALVAYARTGQDAPGLAPCASSFGVWLKGLAAEADAMAIINNNRFNFRLAGELVSGIHVDRLRLRQVLLELLRNAAQFTRNGQITLGVEQRLHTAGTLALVFTVHDTGKGIGPGHLPRVFEPFARCGLGGDCHGAGLAMARHWARLIDAELLAASEAGQGTTLRLTVPATQLSNEPEPHGHAASDVIVPLDTELLAQLTSLVSMGAISDLVDWAHSPQARHASCSLARAVADFAGQADPQGVLALLAAHGHGHGHHQHPASRGLEALPLAEPGVMRSEPELEQSALPGNHNIVAGCEQQTKTW